MTAKDIQHHLKNIASPEAVTSSAKFFKTGPGQYGEGDIFIGIRVPVLRALSREYRSLPMAEIETLLRSPIHEERHLALMILVLSFGEKEDAIKKDAFDFYLRNTNVINNWDLVDCSAPHIVGGYLLDKPRKPLYKLVKSQSLWERRIAIVATQHFIRNDDFADTVEISSMLLNDREDLIHKATGWMLREVGQKDEPVLEAFLKQYGRVMPRTMLRYAIEKFPPAKRQAFLRGDA